MENQLRKYKMNCSATNEPVIFSAFFYNAEELDNPDRHLLNFSKPIYCSKANANCTNCATLKQFIDEFSELEK